MNFFKHVRPPTVIFVELLVASFFVVSVGLFYYFAFWSATVEFAAQDVEESVSNPWIESVAQLFVTIVDTRRLTYFNAANVVLLCLYIVLLIGIVYMNAFFCKVKDVVISKAKLPSVGLVNYYNDNYEAAVASSEQVTLCRKAKVPKAK